MRTHRGGRGGILILILHAIYSILILLDVHLTSAAVANRELAVAGTVEPGPRMMMVMMMMRYILMYVR